MIPASKSEKSTASESFDKIYLSFCIAVEPFVQSCLRINEDRDIMVNNSLNTTPKIFSYWTIHKDVRGCF